MNGKGHGHRLKMLGDSIFLSMNNYSGEQEAGPRCSKIFSANEKHSNKVPPLNYRVLKASS